MVIAKHENELLMVWKDPVTRNRVAIARLWEKDGLYHFKYIREDEDERGSIDLAIRMGYQPIKIFNDFDKEYTSKTLFAPFLNRLKGSERKKNPFEILKKTGGKLNTDNLEFMKPIDENEEQRTVSFYVAGWRYYNGDNVIHNLKEGEKLNFKIEEENLYDNHAIEIWTKNERYKLGYVPAVYSRYLDKLVKEDNYDAKIEEINIDNDPYKILKIKFSGVMVKPNVYKKDTLIA